MNQEEADQHKLLLQINSLWEEVAKDLMELNFLKDRLKNEKDGTIELLTQKLIKTSQAVDTTVAEFTTMKGKAEEYLTKYQQKCGEVNELKKKLGIPRSKKKTKVSLKPFEGTYNNFGPEGKPDDFQRS